MRSPQGMRSASSATPIFSHNHRVWRLLCLVPAIASAAPHVEKWANGTKAVETSFPDGDETRWYQDGTLALRAHYQAGLLDGKYELFDIYGKPLDTGTYAAGVQEGEWLEHGLRGTYQHGLRRGTWKFADGTDAPDPDPKKCDGKIENQMFVSQCWSHGILHGPITYFSPTDIHPLATEENHAGARPHAQGVMRLGRRHGTWSGFYSNGKKRWQGAYVDGFPTGPWTIWATNGKTLATVTLDPAKFPKTLDKDFYKRGDAACPAPAKLVGKPGVYLGCELPGNLGYGPRIQWSGNLVEQILIEMIEQPHGPTFRGDEPQTGVFAFGDRVGAFRREGPDGNDVFFVAGQVAIRSALYEGGVLVKEQAYSHVALQGDSTDFKDGHVEKVRHYIRGYLAAETPPSKPKPPPGKIVRGSQWWKEPNPCPSGTTLAGAPGPSAEIACKKPNGTFHGPYTKLWFNGSVAYEGAFDDGERDGAWQLFYVDGKPLEDSHWKHGLRVGHFVERGPDGALLREGDFVDGLPHGKWKLAEAEGTYDRGIRTADWKHGNDGDLPMDPVEPNWFKRANPCPHDMNFFNGLHAQCSSGDYLHGPWSTRDQRGHVLDRGRYRFGARNGFWHFMYTNGKLAAEGMYRDGYRDGEWTFRSRDGKSITKFHLDAHAALTADCPVGTKRKTTKLRISCRYPDDVENGPVTMIEDNRRFVGMMRDGMREGWWTYTLGDGKSYRQWFQHDELDGSWSALSAGPNGVEERHRLGTPLGRQTERRNGRIREEGVMQGDKRIGTWVHFDDNGQIDLVTTEDGMSIPYESGKSISK